MTPLSALTWTCHVCGDERPDALISVHKRDISAEVAPHLPDGTMFEHVRYCNDRPACVAGAPLRRFIKVIAEPEIQTTRMSLTSGGNEL